MWWKLSKADSAQNPLKLNQLSQTKGFLCGPEKTHRRRRRSVEQETTGTEKLQKVLARFGIASRRVAEVMISEGRVRVNNEVATIGQRVDSSRDEVEVDGIRVSVKPDLVYYLLYKPIDVVSTASDPQGRKTVMDFIPANPRVFPVGRLDRESEGLLLLTNDGEMTYRLTHPSFGIPKEYFVTISGKISRSTLRTLREGVDLEDGRTAPAKVSQVEKGLLRIVIHEGRNRQIRRMCAEVGHPVHRLIRTRIGPISDRQLPPGTFRELTMKEIRSLESAVASVEGDK
ncbi:MAG: MFS transporter [Acidimicrobiaceae bacterium]|nr:MFS transporter [Acidimicrobiaceae bacterium]